MSNSPRKLKVLALASAGGHWVQLRRLSAAFGDAETVYASVYPAYAEEVQGHRYHTFDDVNRFKKMSVFKVAWQIFNIIRKERPQTIVTTGSAPGLMALVLGKYVFRCRTIWIDSVANCEQLSASGERAGRIADLWLTQWEHLARESGPKYWGSVL